MARCDFCFQAKSLLEPPVPRLTVRVCKACNYKIQQVIGFLEHSGAGIYVQPQLQSEEKTPPTPPAKRNKTPKATKSKKKASKEETRLMMHEKD